MTHGYAERKGEREIKICVFGCAVRESWIAIQFQHRIRGLVGLGRSKVGTVG